MEIILSDVYAPEVIKLFSEQDDVMIRFLGKDSIYYTIITMTNRYPLRLD